MNCKIFELFIFTSVLCQVYSLDCCNSIISDYIMSSGYCQTDTISTLTASTWNYVVYSEADIPHGTKCIKHFFDSPYETCNSARMIFYSNNYNMDQTVEDCELEDLGSGLVTDRKSHGRTYNMYFFEISSDVWGYYRCGDSNTNGYDQGACMIACGCDPTDSTVANDIKTCQSVLEAAGITGLTTVDVCTSLIDW